MQWKSNRELRPLVHAALITSPFIAALLTTPMFLISGMSTNRLEVVLAMGVTNVLLLWSAQLLLLKFFPDMYWQRLLVTVASGFLMAGLQVRFAREATPFSVQKAYLIRSLITLSINGIVFIISNYILLIQTNKQLDKENDRLKFINLEARYQLLKNQINPHFLFNSIGTAKALIRKDPVQADQYLVKLASILRLGFDNRSEIVSMEDELSVCTDYAALQEIRFGKALRFDTAIERHYLRFVVPCFSLLTLVENAVKHNSMTEDAPLLISFRNDQDWLIVENNIRPPFAPGLPSGTGLKNLADRYRLLFDQPVKIEKGDSLFRVMLKMMPA